MLEKCLFFAFFPIAVQFPLCFSSLPSKQQKQLVRILPNGFFYQCFSKSFKQYVFCTPVTNEEYHFSAASVARN